MESDKAQLLTNTELEIMLILWSLEEASVKGVLEVMSKSRTVAYTTASTIIRILEKKGFLSSRKEGKGHLYSPLISKEEYETRTLGHMVSKLFNDAPVSLVARLVEDKKLSEKEKAEIRQILKKGKAS